MTSNATPAHYPAFLPTVVDPSPAQAAILAKIAEAVELHEGGDYWRAEKAYRRIIDKHDSPRARALLGLLIHQRAASDRTLAQIREGCLADPNDMLIQGNLGGVYHAEGRITDAIEAYSKAVEAAPQYSQAYVGLGACLADVMRHREAAYAYRMGVEAEPENFSFWSDLIFTTDLSDAHTFDDSLAVRRELDTRMLAQLAPEAPTYANDLNPDRVLNVGYTSADMYQHSGALTWGGWFVNHDKSQVHITSYCGTVKRDQMTDKFEEVTDRWYEVGQWSDERLAQQIRKDKIDILVDLGGYSRGGRIPAFARRPAPIQLSGWGYATGTGLDCMDYFATDEVTVPFDQMGRYHERPWYLPSALSWVTPNEDIPVGHVRAALGREVCFGVFNRQPKLTRSFIKACAEILKRVPGSWMMFKNGSLDRPQVCRALERAFEEEGITEPRVFLTGQGNHWDQLAAHWIPDVMLDPFPQGGGVSAFESLWMGVSYVTMLGDRPGGRAAGSLLHQVGLDDWCTNDVERYVERAVEAARDLETLKALRAGLRERVNAMPATQVKEYAKLIETGYRERWRSWVSKQGQTVDAEAAG